MTHFSSEHFSAPHFASPHFGIRVKIVRSGRPSTETGGKHPRRQVGPDWRELEIIRDDEEIVDLVTAIFAAGIIR